MIMVLHGYGMQPGDLAGPVGLIVGLYETERTLAEWQRLGKFIIVFPDGHCEQGDGCITGNFFADSPNPGNVQAETFLLDLYDYVTANYRVMAPADVDIVE